MHVQGQDQKDAGERVSLKAAMWLLRGQGYEALENQPRALRWYKAALQADPFCYEAFKVLLLGYF